MGWRLVRVTSFASCSAAVTWNGPRCGLAFEQALGVVWYYAESNPTMSEMGRRTLSRIAADHRYESRQSIRDLQTRSDDVSCLAQFERES